MTALVCICLFLRRWWSAARGIVTRRAETTPQGLAPWRSHRARSPQGDAPRSFYRSSSRWITRSCLGVCIGAFGSAWAVLPPPLGAGWVLAADFPDGAECYGTPPGVSFEVPAGMWQQWVMQPDGIGYGGEVFEGPQTRVLVGNFNHADEAGEHYYCDAATQYLRQVVLAGDAPASAASGAGATEETAKGTLNATFALVCIFLFGLGVHGYSVGARDA